MSALASDNFNRGDSTGLGANWTGIGGGGFDVSGNKAVPHLLSGDQHSVYTAISWPNDQYSLAKITVTGTAGTDQGVGVCVRFSSTVVTGYRLVIDHASPGTNVHLIEMTSGTGNILASWSQAFTDGDTFSLEVQGTTLTVKYNGSVLGTATDSAHAAGNAGLAYSSTETSASVDDWEGGDFASSTYPLAPKAGMNPTMQLVA
jgi:hypothetical protein